MNRKERRAKKRADKQSGPSRVNTDIGALLSEAVHLHQTGNLKQAVDIYNRVLAVSPDNADALNLLGLTYHQQDDHTRALEMIGRAIQRSPSVPLYHNNLAMALRGTGQNDAAIDALRKAVTLDPAYVDGWVNLGEALLTTGQADAAVSAYQRALDLAPSAAIVHFDLARCFSDMDDNAAAKSALRRAIALEPRFAEAYERLGALLRDENRPDEAMEELRKALELAPNNEKAWFTMGLVHQDLHQLEAALNAFTKALRLSPDLIEAYHNIGGILRTLGRYDEALAAYDKALALDPDRDDTTSDRALTLLSTGRFKEGWRDFQARRSISDIREILHRGPLPADLSGKRVLILRDQGLGDELFFLRFVPALKARGATVIYRGQSQLTSLIGRLDFLDSVLDENKGEPPADADLCLSAGDLPALLNMTSTNDIPPSVTVPVLLSQAKKITERIQQFGPKPYVGVTWRAGIQKRNRLSKIAPLQAFAAGLSGLDATFIALQREPEPGEIDAFAAITGRSIHDMTYMNNDLEAMLALLDQIDEYVCVSNTNTHLRAALGKPSHVLVPNPADYRWMKDGESSPWFPGSRIYRETYQHGWGPAMDALARGLSATLAAARQE